jgi:hypothetical protein
MIGMRRQFLSACFFALLSAANISAQNAQKLLPDAFGSWHVAGSDVDVQKPMLSQEAQELEYSQCQFTSGNRTATISVGKYRDPSSAYEIYTSLLRPGMQPSALGRFTAQDEHELVILLGNIVIRVNPSQNIATKDLEKLTSIMSAQADKNRCRRFASICLRKTC